MCFIIIITTNLIIYLSHVVIFTVSTFAVSVSFNPNNNHNGGEILVLQTWKVRFREVLICRSYNEQLAEPELKPRTLHSEGQALSGTLDTWVTVVCSQYLFRN